MSSSTWKARDERGSPRLLDFMIWVALNLGRPAARSLLYPITAYFFAFAPATRKASRQFLRRTLPRPPTARDVFRHIHTFAACLLDRIFLLAGRDGEFDIRVQAGAELLPQTPAQGGSLVLVSHLGSFEAMRALDVRSRSLRFRILMDRAHARMIQTAMEKLNPALAEQVIDAGDSGPALALALKQAIESAHVVGIMVDRVRAGEPTVEVDFLGGRVRLPSSPWKFATSLHAPAILCFGLYRGGNRYDLHFEPLPGEVAVPRARRAQAVQALAQGYADRLAHFARSAPYNWFNFFDFWADDRATH